MQAARGVKRTRPAAAMAQERDNVTRKLQRALVSAFEKDMEGERVLDVKAHARELRDDGYTVVPVASVGCARRLAEMVRADMRQYPEFEGDTEDRYVMGAFGGLGNPSSFHGTGVRHVRARVDEVARAIFKHAYADDDEKEELVCEQLFDRLVERHVGDKLGAEGWHRDSTPRHVRVPRDGDDMLVGARENDVRMALQSVDTTAGTLYGGWINLSGEGITQHFVCAPGTHRDRDDSGRSGFAPIEPAQNSSLEALKCNVAVPPGHWLLFQQNLAHKVRSYTVHQRELRLHLAFNVSRGQPHALFGDEYHARVLRHMETPLLPSGQLPPLYSPNHFACFPERLSHWARARLVNDILYVHTFSPKAKRAGEALTLPYRFIVRLPSVTRALSPYSPRDRATLTPRRLFRSNPPSTQ